MPHTSSAWKRLRQDEKRRLHNRAIKKAIKTQIKKVQTTADGDDLEKLRQEATVAIKKLDKAAAKRVIHPNKAARNKAQLARLINAKAGAKKT